MVLGSLEFGSVTYNTVIDHTQPNSRVFKHPILLLKA